MAQPAASMNWQLPGRPGMTGPLLAQGSQELLTWGAPPPHTHQDRTSGSAEQPWTQQNPPVAGFTPQAMVTKGHAQRDRHVSWQGQGVEEPPAIDELPAQQQDEGWQNEAVLQPPVDQLPAVPMAMVPLAAVMSNLQLQDSSLPAVQPASSTQQLAPDEAQQPVQGAALPQPQQPAAASQPQPAPSEAPSAQQPAQAGNSLAQRAATPAVTRRWVRPKPMQQRGWNDSTQSMGTVLRRKLPPAPPRAKSSKPLYSSPLFTARSQQKLDTEQRLSTDGSSQPSPAKALPRKQPSASRLAPPFAPQGGPPHALGQAQQPGQPQQVYQARQTLMMTPMLPGPWGMLQPSVPQQQLMTPVPLQTMQTPAMMSGDGQLKQQQQQQQSAPSLQMLIPAVQARSSNRQLLGQQERILRQVSHHNSQAQMLPQVQHAKLPGMQTTQPQPQQWQQQLPQQPVTGPVAMSPAPWMQGPNQQQMVQYAAPTTLHTLADGNMLPQQMHMLPAQLQAWQSQQQSSRQPSPAPPRAKAQSSSRGIMYGRTASVSGTGQRPSSRAPSTAGSARGSSTGGGGRSRGEWNSHFTKETTRRKTAHIEPPRPTQPYTERLKSMATRRSRSFHDDVDAAGSNAATITSQQPNTLPQYGVPGMLWPQQQPGPMPLQSGGTWGTMAGQVPPQYGGWPPLQAAQWAQQHTLSTSSVQC